MSQGTDDVGSSGRFGPRYGTSVRRRLQGVEEVQFATHRCPQCLTGELDRVSTSVWQCRKCEHKFAGGAYQPQTEAFGKAEASAEEIEEVEVALETDEEEADQPDQPEPVEADEAEDEEPEEAEEPEPEEAEEAEEPEPVEADEAEDDEDEEPDSIESLFED